MATADLLPILHVTNIDRGLTEDQLYAVFRFFGQVVSVRLARHSVTHAPLGDAYVQFEHVEEAKAAQEKLDGQELSRNQRARVVWAQQERPVSKSQVFVKNLEAEVGSEELEALFAAHGQVTSSKVARDVSGASRGYGFVQFAAPEEALAAIAALNKTQQWGREISVEQYLPRHERESMFTNVYVKGFPFSWTNEQLQEHFSSFGEVSSGTIMRDATGASRGFGFVNYADASAAQAAVRDANGQTVAGGDQQLKVARAMRKDERDSELKRRRGAVPHGVNLYVKNLAASVDDDTLRTAFSPFGAVQSARVMRSAKGVSRGFGFVSFMSPEEAVGAISAMDGRSLADKQLSVSFAVQKDERRQRDGRQSHGHHGHHHGHRQAGAGQGAGPNSPGAAATTAAAAAAAAAASFDARPRGGPMGSPQYGLPVQPGFPNANAGGGAPWMQPHGPVPPMGPRGGAPVPVPAPVALPQAALPPTIGPDAEAVAKIQALLNEHPAADLPSCAVPIVELLHNMETAGGLHAAVRLLVVHAVQKEPNEHMAALCERVSQQARLQQKTYAGAADETVSFRHMMLLGMNVWFNMRPRLPHASPDLENFVAFVAAMFAAKQLVLRFMLDMLDKMSSELVISDFYGFAHLLHKTGPALERASRPSYDAFRERCAALASDQHLPPELIASFREIIKRPRTQHHHNSQSNDNKE